MCALHVNDACASVQIEVDVVNEGPLNYRKATIGSGASSQPLNVAVPEFNTATEVTVDLVHHRRKV